MNDNYRNTIMDRAGENTYLTGLRNFMTTVYNYMAAGLLFTGLVAYLTASSPALLKNIYGTPLMYVVMFAPLVMAFMFGAKLHKMSPSAAKALFWAFAGTMGLSISYIFVLYKQNSIFQVFLISAAVFGGASLYGYTTKKSLASWGAYLFMAVWGLFIASIVSMFMHSSQMMTLISYGSVIVFTGLAAYDNQMLKNMYNENMAHEASHKLAIYGALSLYLDFLNIFMALLRLMGTRRD